MVQCFSNTWAMIHSKKYISHWDLYHTCIGRNVSQRTVCFYHEWCAFIFFYSTFFLFYLLIALFLCSHLNTLTYSRDPQLGFDHKFDYFIIWPFNYLVFSYNFFGSQGKLEFSWRQILLPCILTSPHCWTLL